MKRLITRASVALALLAAMSVLAALLGFISEPAAADGPVTYEVTFTNMTSGQPMTPPVVVTHDATTQLATPGTFASAQIEAVAEGGNNAPLLLALADDPGVSYFDVAGAGPFGPGGSVSVTLSAHDGDVLSTINMLVCSNDAITGLNSAALPDEGALTYYAKPYDARTERNTNRAGDVPGAPPCAGLRAGGGADQDGLGQNKKIKSHPGLHNAGVLSFSKHDQVIQITVERIDSDE
jgi:hypothetical protein